MPNDDAFDIGTIDLKALSPKEWEALKQRIIRRAHAERAQAISAMFAWLFGRLRGVSHADIANYRRVPGWSLPVTVPEAPTEA